MIKKLTEAVMRWIFGVLLPLGFLHMGWSALRDRTFPMDLVDPPRVLHGAGAIVGACFCFSLGVIFHLGCFYQNLKTPSRAYRIAATVSLIAVVINIIALFFFARASAPQ